MRILKLFRFLFWSLAGGCACALSWLFLRWTKAGSHFQFLSRTAHWTARRTAKTLGLRIRVCLETRASYPDEAVLIAANHRGYLDIVSLFHAMPLRFVSKSELRAWPIFGPLAMLLGTLFCRRGSPRHGRTAMTKAARALQQGTSLAFFPEGTSSAGPFLLPFSNLFFESAVLANCPVIPVHLEYVRVNGKTPDAALRDRVCWHGAQTFLPHFWSLLGLESIEVEIRVGTPLSPTLGRKTLCRATYAEIVALSHAWKLYTAVPIETSRKQSGNILRTIP